MTCACLIASGVNRMLMTIAQTIRRSRWWNYRNDNDFRNHIGFGGNSDIHVCSEIQEMSSRPGDGDIWENYAKSVGWKEPNLPV